MVIVGLVISLTFLLASVATFFMHFVRRKVVEYAGIAVGFMLFYPHIIAEIMLVLIPVDPQNSILITKLISSGVSLLIGAFLAIYFSIKTLVGSKITFWQKMNMLYSYFFMGASLLFIKVEPVDGVWGVKFIPPWIIIFLAVAVVSIVLRITSLLFSILREYKNKLGKRLILSGMFFLLLSFTVALVERQFSETSVYFLLFYPMGLFLVSLALLFDPFLFVPTNHGIKLILVTEKAGFEIQYSLAFEEIEIEKYVQALRGTYELLDAIKGYPQRILYHTNEIIMIESERFIVFLVTERHLPPVISGLRQIVDHFEQNLEVDYSSYFNREFRFLFR